LFIPSSLRRSMPDQRSIDFPGGIIHRVDHGIDASIGQVGGLGRRQLAGSANGTGLSRRETGDDDNDGPVVMKMHLVGQAGQRRPGNSIGQGQGSLIKAGRDTPGGLGRIGGPGVDEGPCIIDNTGLSGCSRGSALLGTGKKHQEQAGSSQHPGREACPCRTGRWVHINCFDPMKNKRHPPGPGCPRKSSAPPVGECSELIFK